jgi:predicted metalloendopeptidase
MPGIPAPHLRSNHEQPDPEIAGVPFTPEQLFFIGYGRLWCASQSPQANQMQLLDVHSPAYWRMMVPLKNNPAFAAAFKCAAGSSMSPLDRPCTLW